MAAADCIAARKISVYNEYGVGSKKLSQVTVSLSEASSNYKLAPVNIEVNQISSKERKIEKH